VKYGIGQPSMPMPGIFSAIAGRQRAFYAGKRTEEFCGELPPGVIEFGEQRVESTPISADGSKNTCFIRGRFDFVIKFDDGTYGVIDCKTASPSESKTKMYGRQLQCYAYALENPAPGNLSLSPVTKLGLLYFNPTGFEQINESQQAFQGDLVWHEVERNDHDFLSFLSDVVKVLDSEEVYPGTCDQCDYCRNGNACLAGKKEAYERGCVCCSWCTYRLKMREIDPDSTASLTSPRAEDCPTCPECGSAMNKRNGKFGEFWSCRRYPDCKGTRNV